MQEEEAGQAERVDHAQLLLQAGAGLVAVRARGRVALLEAVGAQLGEVAGGLGVLRAGVAVAEVLVEVEGQAVGELSRVVERLRVVVFEPRLHRLGRGEDVGEVAAPQRLGGVERRVVAQGDEGVLERRRASGRGRGRCRWRRSARPRARQAAPARCSAPGRRAGTGAAAPRAGGRRRRSRSAAAGRPRRARPGGRSRSGRRGPGRAPPASSSGTCGGGSSLSRSCTWAAVTMRQRLRQPVASSTSSVTWRPSSSAISAPWMARRPRPAAAMANSIEPHRPSWSVSANAS